MDVNVPTVSENWKLGYGPGSADQFADEEATYHINPPQLKADATQPAYPEKKINQVGFFYFVTM